MGGGSVRQLAQHKHRQYTGLQIRQQRQFSIVATGRCGLQPKQPLPQQPGQYFLPSVDEWYKAAYLRPMHGVYYDYPTGSDTSPTAVASGTAADTAVYGQSFTQAPQISLKPAV